MDAERQGAAEAELERRRAFYQSLVGAAVGGRYQIERLIDFGAMGAVFEARHKSDERAKYAVKVLDPDLARRDRRYVQRFVREARILEEADHENIVKVFEHGRYEPPGAEEPVYYYVMELVEGAAGPPVTLHSYARQRQLRMEEVVLLVSQILSGLRHVHERGVIHRDLKPWNVLIDKKGRCRIVDFGLAKIPDSDLTDVDELFGSQEYIAPELYYRGAREATASSDIFAVGRIFADLVDQVDFSRSRAGVFASKAAALKYLDELLKTLVQEDPKLRFDTADRVLRVLEDFQETTRIRSNVGTSARLEKEDVVAAATRRRWFGLLGRWILDYALFVVGVAILPLVWLRSAPVGALLAGSLVTSKLWSALSHPPDRHPIAIVVKALAARLNRTLKEGDFHVHYYTPSGWRAGRLRLRPRYVSHGHRRDYGAFTFEEGSGVVGLAARARTSVVLHSVPRFGGDAYRDLWERHLRVPEATWKLLDPTRRSSLAVPIFRIGGARRGHPALRVAGILAVESRTPDAVLRSEVTRAVRDYATVIQDVIEPVHGAGLQGIIAGGAAPLEHILINGAEPRIPPLESRATFEPSPGGEG
jgi:tRNA A-37 threonylcarbamoyl transferase component Bud32